MLGNSGSGGAPTFSDAETDTRAHNAANELLARVFDEGGGGEVELDQAYDASGNLVESHREGSPATTITYAYDAWNRLTRVAYGETDRAAYEYNGLHWRTRSLADTTAVAGLDEVVERYYDASWRLLEERMATDFPDGESVETKRRTVQHVWGERYIDDAVMMRVGVEGTEPDWDRRWWRLTDALFSVVALLRDNGEVHERVTYDPYGRARHHWNGDINRDGGTDSVDNGLLLGAWGTEIGDTNYLADADLNRDGEVDSLDLGLLLGAYNAALPEGLISNAGSLYGPTNISPGNTIGWAGYVFTGSDQSYYVRRRTYNSEPGRWHSRDWFGYIDGSNLYEYTISNPVTYIDPLGSSTACNVSVRCPPEVHTAVASNPDVVRACQETAAACGGPDQINPAIQCGPCLLQPNTNGWYNPITKRIRLCNQVIGTLRLAPTLIHELRHGAQDCARAFSDLPDSDRRVCRELDAYCREPDPGVGWLCDDSRRSGDWSRPCRSACNSAVIAPLGICFDAKHDRCMERCKRLVNDGSCGSPGQNQFGAIP